jgi:DNA invertase Pin-like site-specific DNA recombinase
MSLIGYARVSTEDQNLELQTDALKVAGCEKIFVEKASGGDRDRPMLAKALNYVRDGDVFCVWKLDRAGRSVLHLIEIIEDLKLRKVDFKSLNDAIDTTTASGRLMFTIMAAFAEFERNIIRERTMAGLAAGRSRGRVGGRPKGLRKIDGKWVRTGEAAA